jgi:hypothetical protein
MPHPCRFQGAVTALVLLSTSPLTGVAEAAPCRDITPLARLEGEAGWRFGSALAGLGDIDGDGTPDFAVGAPGARPHGLVLVLSGRDFREIRRHEGIEDAAIGEVLAEGGDVDRDGVRDLLVGAPTATSRPLHQSGRVFVFSGRTGEVIHDIQGTRLYGGFGSSVASSGDIDRDGHGDFVVGQPGGDGSCFVISGRTGQIGPPRSRFSVYPTDEGYVVASLGTVEGVQQPGFLLGCPYVSTGVRDRLVGEFCLYGGSSAATPQFCRIGSAPLQRLGIAVAGLGDLDGDRRVDFAVTASGSSPVVQIYSATGNLLREHSNPAVSGFGSRLGPAGDLDLDGATDLLVGAHGGNGRFWLYAGRGGRLLFEQAGSNGERLGQAFAGLGDIAGDGGHQFAVGAPLATVAGAESSGAVIVYGRPAPRATVSSSAARFACAGEPQEVSVDLENLEDQPLHFRIQIGSGAGLSLRLEPGESTSVVIPSTVVACSGDGTGLVSGRVFWRDTECEIEASTPVALTVTCEDCRLRNCPRPLAFWRARCAGDPNTWPLPHDWAALRDCVMLLAPEVPSPAGLCADLLEEDGWSGALVAARAEFLALLLNHCAGRLTTPRPEEVRLRVGTPIAIAGSDCDDLACLFDDFHGRFRSLASRSEREPEVLAAYRTIRDASRAFNLGQGLGEICTIRREEPPPSPMPLAPGLRLLANPVRRGNPLEVRATVTEPTRIRLELFSVTGGRVRILDDFEHPGGELNLAIPLDDHGLRIPAAGLYVVRMTSPELVRSVRVVLLD